MSLFEMMIIVILGLVMMFAGPYWLASTFKLGGDSK